MKNYIDNLIPRLKEFSSSLDKIEIFIDKSWLLIDGDNLHRYIFKRNGELIMSLNGKVDVGKWEYLTQAKMLLIDRNTDKILLSQNFVDPAIMVLKIDGENSNGFILANEQLIPDLNVNQYLQKLYRDKNNVAIINIKGNIKLEVLRYNIEFDNNKVSIMSEDVADTILEDQELNKYVIKNSRLVNILINTLYSTNLGDISIEHRKYFYPVVGDKVYNGKSNAIDGKYKLSFMNHVIVENGIIIKKTSF